jgi:hypothetical protein
VLFEHECAVDIVWPGPFVDWHGCSDKFANRADKRVLRLSLLDFAHLEDWDPRILVVDDDGLDSEEVTDVVGLLEKYRLFELVVREDPGRDVDLESVVMAELVELASAVVVGDGSSVESVEGPAEHVCEDVITSLYVLYAEFELG